MAADPFEVLGLDSGASLEEARAAYRRLAEIYHPDRYQDARPEVRAEAAQRMSDLNGAWEAIKSGRADRAAGKATASGSSASSSEARARDGSRGPASGPPSRRPPTATRARPRYDPVVIVGLTLLIGVIVVGVAVAVAGNGGGSSPSSDNTAAAPAASSPAAASRSTTTSSSTTTTTEASEPETSQTVPGPPSEPEAPWASGVVAPTGVLIDVVTGWNDARSFDDPWQCSLHAPTELESQVGLVSSFYPQATRIGDFQFGWDDGAGGSAVVVSIWPADNPNVDRFFADPAPTVYADGSETRQDPAGSAYLSDTLISIPGEPCHYEVSCDTTVSCSWAFESFREVAT